MGNSKGWTAEALANAQRGIYFFWTVSLEEHAEKLVGGEGNDYKAPGDTDHESPAQNMSDNIGDETKHIERPRSLRGFYH